MYKNLINKHLSNRLVSEESHPSMTKTNSVQNAEKDFNKEYYNDVKKKMADYDSAAKQEDKDAIEAPKTNIEDETKDFHDQMEIRNGMEMLQYDNEPSERFKDRAVKALEGDSTMGNKTYTGKDNGNTEEVWGASGGKNTGEEIVKAARASEKKRNDAEYNLIQFGDDIENSGDAKTRGKARKIAVENKANNDKPLNESKMKKRLRFKKPFDGVGNALQLIPEHYKVDNKEFQMTDGNETYDIRWEGNLQEGKAIVMSASDANMVNEDIQKMKHLMGYKSKDTLGVLSGQARIDESNNNPFRTMLDKTRGLMTESVEAVEETEEVTEMENIDGQKAPVDNSVWDDAKGPQGDNHGDHIMEDEVNEDEEVTETEDIDGQKAPVVKEEDINESKKKELAESIVALMEATGLSEEDVIEGFFGGPSKDEQTANQQALMQKAEQLATSAQGKNWKVAYLYEKQPVGSLEELMQIAAKNKFRGQMVPRPIQAKGTLYIEYQKGLTGLQKMASGSGSQTVGS